MAAKATDVPWKADGKAEVAGSRAQPVNIESHRGFLSICCFAIGQIEMNEKQCNVNLFI